MIDRSLTLIVPSYNNARYLPDLINSVFGGQTSLGEMKPQTLLPDQIIIADDCSTDNTEEVVYALSQLHSIIEYFRLQKNSGTAIASNEAVKRSRGRFITRIDSDDMREYYSFENMMIAQLSYPTSYIYDDVMIFVNGQRKGKVWPMGEYDFEKLLRRNSNHAGIMFPKSAWEMCGGYPEEFWDGRDDWSFNVALGTVGCCGIHIGGGGYLYRREQQNRTVKNSSAERQKYYYQKMIDHFPNLYSGRFPMACCGNRGKATTVSQSTNGSVSTLLAGSAGMTLLQYNGENYGKETYFGPVTGTAYVFSKVNNIKNVDNRDLTTSKSKGLLDLVDHGKSVFSVYNPPAPVQPTVVEQIIEQVEPTVNRSAELTPVTTVTPPTEGLTPIKSGQVSGVTAKIVKLLETAGIVTWEKFYDTDSAVLSEITGKSVDAIELIKKEISSD